MGLQYNQYYTIKAAGPEAVKITTTLLHSYPVTRACFGILGNRLLDQVGFGFFTEEKPVIVQNETGKDLFLLCDEAVDVFVDEKKVVQMHAPALLGDKGIVEPESKRAATIKAAPEKTCLFLKIPMGLFIRDFDDMSIADESFEQEIGIFYNMFKGIQNRLFEYAFIQKNLWEEALTTQTLARTQHLIKMLDNRIDQQWDESIWETVRGHLFSTLKFRWPDGVPLDISTFRNLLKQHLDQRFPRESFKGEDAEYIKRKHQIWRKWLASTASAILKELPPEKGGLEERQIQLFNPRNYQLRIQGLIRAIEKRFLSSKVRDLSGENPVSKASGADTIRQFFGRNEQDNTFDLKSYLNSFEQTFKLKYPKRMQMQIAQRTALVAAKVENEFNESVAVIKSKLEDYQQQLSGSSAASTSAEASSGDHRQHLTPLLNAVKRHYQHLDEPILGKVGKITYKHEVTPNIGYLIKTAGSKPIKEELSRAVQSQVKQLNISARLLPFGLIQSSFFLCDAKSGYEVHQHDLERHYWIPLTEGMTLFAGEKTFGRIDPGSVIGGRGWVQEASDEQGHPLGPWKLKLFNHQGEESADDPHLVVVFPSQHFPWVQTARPDARTYKTVHLPVMQWLINKQISHIQSILPLRDELFENLQKTEQVLRLENKLKAFETRYVKISATAHRKIIDFLKNSLGISLPRNKPFASHKLSKHIYNYILIQIKTDFPNLTAEQVGNKTYTQWRLILSEIIQLMEQSELVSSALSSTPIFEIIENELGSLLESFAIPKAREYVKLTEQTPYILLPHILQMLENPESDQQLLFDLILSTFETYLRLLFEEIDRYKTQYEAASQKKPKTDVQELQVQTILESAARLKEIIMQKQPGTAPAASAPVEKTA